MKISCNAMICTAMRGTAMRELILLPRLGRLVPATASEVVDI